MLRARPSLSAFFLLTTLISTLCVAAPVKIIGFDDMSCALWVKSKDDTDLRNNYLAWIRGALTGHNYARQSQQVSIISNATVENFVDRYCFEKPQGTFSDAAMRMSDKFSGRNDAITK